MCPTPECKLFPTRSGFLTTTAACVRIERPQPGPGFLFIVQSSRVTEAHRPRMLIWSMIRPSKKGPSHSSGGGQTALSALSRSANSRDGRFLCPICPDQSSAGSHGTVAAPRVWLPACLFMMDAACLALLTASHGRLQKCLAQANPLPRPAVKCLLRLGFVYASRD